MKYAPKPKIITEQVMKYAPKPKIITEQKNVMDLCAELVIPIKEAKNISDRMIKDQLVKDIAKGIEPYIKVSSYNDLPRMEITYKARLEVIDRRYNNDI